MKNIDDSSDWDDVPLSSLGVKTSSRKKEKKTKEPIMEDTSPSTKKIAKEKSDKTLKKTPDKVAKGKSLSSPKKKKSPSPKKKMSEKSKSSKKLKVKKRGKSKEAIRKDTKKKAKAKKSPKDDSEEPTTLSINTKAIITASSQLYSSCDKGKLIQHCLCRWWYAYTWPDPNFIPTQTPAGCDALDGFPGIYVVTSGPNVGQILDFRNQEMCPSFTNFSKKTSEELKSLLIEAISNQKAALIEAEGSGTDTEERLNDLHKWASKINGQKADKDAEKFFKAMNMVP